jgi:phage tail-like protein
VVDSISGFDNASPTAATFLIEIDNIEIGRFEEVHGLEVEIAVTSFKEGGQNGHEHKLPGRMSWPNLVFKRGIIKSDSFFAWMQKSSGDGFTGEDNKLTRSTCAITVLSQQGQRLRAWEVEGAFPVKWTGPRLAAASSQTLDEELEVAHHGFRTKTF